MIRGLRSIGMGALAATLVAGPALAAAPNSGKVSFNLGTDVTTAYFFRGILQERNGLIAQPYGDVSYSLHEAEGAPISSVSLTGGLWASVHSALTGNSGSGPRSFYELDVFGGVNVGLFDVLDFGTMYTAYISPNGAFDNVQEVSWSLGLDDSQWLGAFALNPSALVALELEGAADGTTSRGTYGQIGIEPSFPIIPFERYPISLSLPMTVGFSLSDYYENARGNDQTWGFASFGAMFGVPLAFIPEEYGSWSAVAGATLYTFNTNLQRINGDDDPWVVGTWGISMAY